MWLRKPSRRSRAPTGQNENVLVVFDQNVIAYEALLKVSWEAHDPTQGMRQGSDLGTHYRSGIYFSSADQERAARDSQTRYQAALSEKHVGKITTEILPAPDFYYA